MDQVLGSQSEAGLRAWPVTGKSAASWPAILAGAFVAVSASLILIVLGSGFGFAAVSPWPGRGVSAAGLTVTAAIWLIVTQWISAALGGYVAGRVGRGLAFIGARRWHARSRGSGNRRGGIHRGGIRRRGLRVWLGGSRRGG